LRNRLLLCAVELTYSLHRRWPLSKAEEQQQDMAADKLDLMQLPIIELITALIQRRRFLITTTAFGILLAVSYAFLLPNEYESMAQLMPPDQQTFSSVSALTALTGAGPLLSSAGSLMSVRTPGATAIGILSSRTAEDDIVNRFDLRAVYHRKLYVDARKKLAERTVLDEDKKTGLVGISVMDRDPRRARDITEAYVEELNKLLSEMNTSVAHREREFLEGRLKSLKSDLDSASNRLSQFSSRNATLNPQVQGQALLEAAAKLQAELITAQSELNGLKAQYSDENVRVRAAQARVDELQSQLRKMGGIGEQENGGDLKSGQLYPSIRELPLLGVTYSDLYRQVTMEENIYETLTKQYEMAKVQEAKEIPVIKVLDRPTVAEKKSSPRRSLIILFGGLVSAFAAFLWVIACKLWEIADNSLPMKALVLSIIRTVRRCDLKHQPNN